MVVVQFALIPERVAQKTVPKLFQTKDGTKFTNIIGVSLRTINIFESCWNNIVETITPVRPRKKTTGKKKKDLLESIIWRMRKVKRLGFVRKCSSLQSIWLQIKQLGLCCQEVEGLGQMMYLIKGQKLNLQTKKTRWNFRLS